MRGLSIVNLLWLKPKQNSLTKTLSSLLHDSFVYFLGTVMLGLGNFVLVPLYTRFLLPSEFGVYSLIDVSVMTIVTVTQLGLSVAYLRWYATDKPNRGKLLGSVGLVSVSSALVGGTLFSFYVLMGASWGKENPSIIYLLLPIIVVENLQGVLLTDLRGQRNAWGYSASMVFRLLVLVSSSILFIAVMDLGVTGIFLGRLVGSLSAVLYLLYLSTRSVRPSYDWSIVKPMIKYGIPIMLAGAMAMLLDMAGRYALDRYVTLDQVGYYGTAIKISGLFQMLVTQPFGIAWGGVMFQIEHKPNAKLIYSRIFSYSLYGALFIALAITLVSPILFSVFAGSLYLPAAPIFPLVLLVRAVGIMMYASSIGLYLSAKTNWFIAIYAFAFVVDVVLNMWLVPQFGVFGAGVSWLLAWLIIVLLMTVIGHYYYPLSYSLGLILVAMGAWGIFLWRLTDNMRWIFQQPWHVQIAGSLIVLLIASVGLYIDVRQLGPLKESKVT